MKSAATIFAAVASMALVSACATANGQTSNSSAATRVASSDETDGARRDARVRRLVRRGIDAESIIENYDSDEDGRISREEYNNRANRGRFSALDADEDGFIDEAELETDMEERMAERMERHAERRAERMEHHAERMERHAERAMRNAERYQERILERLDRNGDGEITGEDFDFDFNFEFDGEGFRERMQEHRASTLKKLDSDGDGVVSRDEFAARQNKRFDKLDKDQNGTLSADELGGMEMMRGFVMPDFERFGMGRHGGHRLFRWSDDNDGETDEDSGEESGETEG
ncbi:MAG: EF-hand domain-containing protein [Proteobacteria bacterium]|nr:EF-hand domain-containing protein [Pseudomonadota bacterium]